jgi:hypothetical protein
MECRICFDMKPQCGKCHQKIVEVPAKFAEFITEQFNVQCSYAEKGCTESVAYKVNNWIISPMNVNSQIYKNCPTDIIFLFCFSYLVHLRIYILRNTYIQERSKNFTKDQSTELGQVSKLEKIYLHSTLFEEFTILNSDFVS